MSEPLAPDRIIELGNAFMASGALLSAIDLDLFSQLAKGPLDAGTLRERLGVHQRGAQDFFDALVALGLLERDGDQYANTPETDVFLDRAKPSYVGAWFSGLTYRRWGALTDGLRSGQPQYVTMEETYATGYSDPTRARAFLQRMTSIHMRSTQAVAQQFPWGKYRTFIDVGGNLGGLAVQVALAHAHLSGGGFDLPGVGPFFEEYVQSFGLSDRLRFYPGNFFTDPLPQADVLVMGHILMDWSPDERCLLIAKAYEALPTGGALLVYETFIDDERRQNARGLLMSLFMHLLSPGGGEYTGTECCAWMRAAGFRNTSIEPLTLSVLGPESMVVGVK